MAPEPQADQQEMQKFKRREVRLVHKPLMTKNLRSWFARPVEILDGPVDEVALESLGRGQADAVMLQSIAKRQLGGAQYR